MECDEHKQKKSCEPERSLFPFPPHQDKYGCDDQDETNDISGGGRCLPSCRPFRKNNRPQFAILKLLQCNSDNTQGEERPACPDQKIHIAVLKVLEAR